MALPTSLPFTTTQQSYRPCHCAGSLWQTLENIWKPTCPTQSCEGLQLEPALVHKAAQYVAVIQRSLELQLENQLHPGDVPELRSIAVPMHIPKLRKAWEEFFGEPDTC